MNLFDLIIKNNSTKESHEFSWFFYNEAAKESIKT